MYWNIKVYDSETGEEQETIRGIHVGHKDTLMRIFDREGVQAQAMAFDDDGEEMLQSESVNWGANGIEVPFRPEREHVTSTEESTE